ncbi:MAG: hypothetical protein JWO82_2140 [Akkermansiaceae bacterium]|nr:hypothetical protein [Akkermansiaceae bacterium]
MTPRSRLLLGAFTCLCLIPVVRAEDPAPLPDLPPVVIQPAPGPGPEAGSKVRSRSGQFQVSGGELAQRSSLALLLEESRASLQGLLEESDEPVKTPRGETAPPPMIPINVVLEGKPGDPPKEPRISYDLRYTDDGFLLGMRIDLARGIDTDELDHATLALLLYERSLRGVKPADLDGPLVVRPWLVEGLREAKVWKEDHGDWQLYQGVLKSGGGFSMEELFEMDEEHWKALDPSSQMSFRALSGATAMALLGQPKGHEAFRTFIGEAARNAGETPVLMRRHFPDLNLSEKSLAKWVQLTLAQISQPKLTESMSVAATESGLEDALKLHFRDKDGNAVVRGIDAWKEVAALKDAERAGAVRVAQEGLIRLSYRCFPSYRDALAEYQQILKDLAKGNTKKIEQQLVELKDERQIRKQRAERARDYMDYFEISRARNLSGQFADYMKLKQELDDKPRGDRTDRMSHAMDVMNATYDKKVKRPPAK